MAKKKAAAKAKKGSKKAAAIEETPAPTRKAGRPRRAAASKRATPARPSKLARERGRITPRPPRDAAKLLPALASRWRIAVRLHPQRADVPDLRASKLGGEILWPREEPWPICESPTHKKNKRPALVAILQLRKDEVPELGFPPDRDLFQLLWCPSHEHDTYCPLPAVVWRNSAKTGETAPNPAPVNANESYLPKTCRITTERVIEYPPPGEVESKVLAPLEDADGNLWGMYQFEMSACPGTKVGGYPGWVQDVVPIRCSKGHTMEFLLQLTDSEYSNVSAHPRWIPQADRWVLASNRSSKKERERSNAVFNPADLSLGHSVYYFFVCRKCKSLPVTMYAQR